ncbi:hypothetical protein ACFWDQ_14040 [Streptomyces sp. NPDC060053]|uniref:hypothetical protein n=1 Tax=Streptomyces sp. NPDC060053 TaxID=3347047 RepID=UPI00368FD3D7
MRVPLAAIGTSDVHHQAVRAGDVESPTGTPFDVEGIPCPALRRRLTPDSMPERLYNGVGKAGLKP